MDIYDISDLIDLDLLGAELDDMIEEAALEDPYIDTGAQGEEDLDLRSLWAVEMNCQSAEEKVTYLLHHGYETDILTLCKSHARSGHARLAIEKRLLQTS